MRDFEADIKLCERATPGPWVVGDHTVNAPNGYALFVEYAADKKDLEFIAKSREGWPAALKEIERLREEARIKDGLFSKAAEDLQEYESEYKWLCEENEQLREENKRMKDGIQHILDFYPIEKVDYIPIDILFEIHMKLKAIVKKT